MTCKDFDLATDNLVPLTANPNAIHELKPYKSLENEELNARISAVRQELGDRLMILGHHYQQDEVIEQSDLRGDSYLLSETAAASKTCETIVFCGVHFMAETADILANRPEKLAERDGRKTTVILPDMAAGCSMADMAAIAQVEAAWADMAETIDTDRVIPVTYINSSAALKAFCGRNGGIVCTSSNAAAVMDWAFERGDRVFFFPDQHLGRNTALKMGITEEQMPVWDPYDLDLGGNSEEKLAASKVILWKGHCSVHQMFRAEHVHQFREQHPGIKILVHPECPREVNDLADVSGSTGTILRTVQESPAGTKWADRHRTAPGEPIKGRASGAGDSLPEPRRVHVCDDVPDRSTAPVLGAGKPARRCRGQQDRG